MFNFLQYIKVGADNMFMCSLWRFPEYWRILKTVLLLDLEFLKGCWHIGAFCLKAWSEYLLYNLEKCWAPCFQLKVVVTACAQHFSKWHRNGLGLSHISQMQRCSLGCCQDALLAQWIPTKCFQSGMVLNPFAAGWWNWTWEFSAGPPCCVCDSIGGVSSAEEDSSDEAGLTDFHHRLRKWSQASGGRVLVFAETLGCPSFAVLLQHSISILPVLKEVFYSLCFVPMLWWGL